MWCLIFEKLAGNLNSGLSYHIESVLKIGPIFVSSSLLHSKKISKFSFNLFIPMQKSTKFCFPTLGTSQPVLPFWPSTYVRSISYCPPVQCSLGRNKDLLNTIIGMAVKDGKQRDRKSANPFGISLEIVFWKPDFKTRFLRTISMNKVCFTEIIGSRWFYLLPATYKIRVHHSVFWSFHSFCICQNYICM